MERKRKSRNLDGPEIQKIRSAAMIKVGAHSGKKKPLS